MNEPNVSTADLFKKSLDLSNIISARLDVQKERLDNMFNMLKLQQAAIINLVQVTQELNPGNSIPEEVQELINDWENK